MVSYIKGGLQATFENTKRIVKPKRDENREWRRTNMVRLVREVLGSLNGSIPVASFIPVAASPAYIALKFEKCLASSMTLYQWLVLFQLLLPRLTSPYSSRSAWLPQWLHSSGYFYSSCSFPTLNRPTV